MRQEAHPALYKALTFVARGIYVDIESGQLRCSCHHKPCDKWDHKYYRRHFRSKCHKKYEETRLDDKEIQRLREAKAIYVQMNPVVEGQSICEKRKQKDGTEKLLRVEEEDNRGNGSLIVEMRSTIPTPTRTAEGVTASSGSATAEKGSPTSVPTKTAEDLIVEKGSAISALIKAAEHVIKNAPAKALSAAGASEDSCDGSPVAEKTAEDDVDKAPGKATAAAGASENGDSGSPIVEKGPPISASMTDDSEKHSV